MQSSQSTQLLTLMLLFGALSAIVSLCCTPLAARMALKMGAVAVPRGRDVHDRPVPRWGGLSLFAGFFVAAGAAVAALGSRISPATLFQGVGIVVGGAIVTAVGAIDDRKDLRPGPRLLAQAMASLIAYICGVRVELLKVPFLGHAVNTHWLAAPITVFWMLLLMNAINWLDGLDGLAGGVSVIVLLFLALVAVLSHKVCLALLCATLAGSTLGFLRYNFSPARIYMGGGAEFLGFMLAAVSIVGSFKQVTTLAVVVPLLALALPILDSFYVIVRRALSGDPVYQADRRHFHHRLMDMGLTKQQAVLVLYAITIALCGSAWGLLSYVRASAPHVDPRHTISSLPIRAPSAVE